MSIFLRLAAALVLGRVARLVFSGVATVSNAEAVPSLNFLTEERLFFAVLTGASLEAFSSGRAEEAEWERPERAAVFFLIDMVASFRFITAHPCFLAMTTLPVDILRWNHG